MRYISYIFLEQNIEMHFCLYTIMCFCFGLFLLPLTGSLSTVVVAQVVKTGIYTCK